jgi:hypothetical protein
VDAVPVDLRVAQVGWNHKSDRKFSDFIHRWRRWWRWRSLWGRWGLWGRWMRCLCPLMMLLTCAP